MRMGTRLPPTPVRSISRAAIPRPLCRPTTRLRPQKTAGSQSITATDTTTSSITGAQPGITVNPAAADHLASGVQPSNTVAGVAISPAITVQILDKFNNLVTTDNTDSIELAIGTNPSSGTLSGTTTLTAGGGVATFSNLAIDRAGSGYTLSTTSGSLAG